jgi:hypothetical protein
MGHLAGGLGVPWLLALVLAGLIAVPIGALIAIPAIRLSGIFLALATLGCGILIGARVILVDEASMGLSPIMVDQVFAFLAGVAAVGASLLVVEQTCTAPSKSRATSTCSTGAGSRSPAPLRTSPPMTWPLCHGRMRRPQAARRAFKRSPRASRLTP